MNFFSILFAEVFIYVFSCYLWLETVFFALAFKDLHEEAKPKQLYIDELNDLAKDLNHDAYILEQTSNVNLRWKAVLLQINDVKVNAKWSTPYFGLFSRLKAGVFLIILYLCISSAIFNPLCQMLQQATMGFQIAVFVQ